MMRSRVLFVRAISFFVSADGTVKRSGRADTRNLLEALVVQAQVKSVTAAAESVLHRLKDATATKVLVLLLDGELHHRVDHVLKLLCAGHFATLVDLADDHRVDVVLLAVVSDEGQRALRAPGVNLPVVVVSVVHALERVHDEEEGLLAVLPRRAKLIALLEKSGDVGLLSNREAAAQPKTLSDELDLEKRLLSSVEHHQPTLLGEPIGQVEHHGRLTRAGGTGEQDDLRGRETLTAQGAVDVLDATLNLVSESVRNLDVQDVGSEGDVVVAHIELHVCFFPLPLEGLPVQLLQYTMAATNLHYGGTIVTLFCRVIIELFKHRYKLADIVGEL